LYILKTKGTSKIPDYLQVRDDDFILVHHCRIDHAGTGLQSIMPVNDADKIRVLIESLPFGKLVKPVVNGK